MKSTVLQFLFVLFSYSNLSSAVKYSDPFEDFLMRERLRVEQEQQRNQQQEYPLPQRVATDLGNNNEYESSGLSSIAATTPVYDSTSTDLTTMTVDESMTTTSSYRRQTQSTCCMLGERAGRSGFLCNPENYRPQVLMRHDMNRMGNFKVSREDQQRYIEVRQHSKCISGAVPRLSDEFQLCCKRAYIETLDEEVIGVPADDDSGRPIMLELPLQIDIISKQRKIPRQKAHKV